MEPAGGPRVPRPSHREGESGSDVVEPVAEIQVATPAEAPEPGAPDLFGWYWEESPQAPEHPSTLTPAPRSGAVSPRLPTLSAAASTPAPDPELVRRTPRFGLLRRTATIAGVAALAATSGAVAGIVATADSGGDVVAVEPAVVTPVNLVLEPLSVGAVVDRLADSVVSIETTIESNQGRFRRQGTGAGTGIVLQNGYILTNAHVVNGATAVEITVPSSGRPVPATVVGLNARRDVAVLRVSDTAGLVPVEVAPDSSEVGDDVVAIGNALALEGGLTVTSGIVSALDRSIGTSEGELQDLIQTDAAISSGNSGGALVNVFGQVIGMNTAVATGNSQRAASNIGFAISVDAALEVASEIVGEDVSALI